MAAATTTADITFADAPGVGIVRRWWGSGLTSISVLRPGRKECTFQGEIMPAALDGWRAYGALRNGRCIDLGVFANWADAEKALLARRTGCVSSLPWTGPRPAAPRRAGTVTCDVCGWDYPADGQCQRPELHWTRESIAAEDERRRQRQLADAGQ